MPLTCPTKAVFGLECSVARSTPRLWHMVVVDNEPRVGVQLAPGHVPPDWPDGSPPQQIHLDLCVDDFQAAHDEVMSLGAKLLKAAAEVQSDDNFRSTRIRPGIRSACVGSTTPSSFRARTGSTGRSLGVTRVTNGTARRQKRADQHAVACLPS